MANFKKILCLMLVFVMMLAFVACNDNPDDTTESSSSEETTESSSETGTTTETESTETESGLREVENGNDELGPGWTVPIPPDYTKK